MSAGHCFSKESISRPERSSLNVKSSRLRSGDDKNFQVVPWKCHIARRHTVRVLLAPLMNCDQKLVAELLPNRSAAKSMG